jgi:hypothetical protein
MRMHEIHQCITTFTLNPSTSGAYEQKENLHLYHINIIYFPLIIYAVSYLHQHRDIFPKSVWFCCCPSPRYSRYTMILLFLYTEYLQA